MALWTPAEITTALWLDAAASGTIHLDGSSNVEQWDDKSGNDRHATQATVGSRPAFTTNVQNGLSALSFDLDFLHSDITSNQPLTILAVCQSDQTGSYRHYLIDGDDSTNRCILALNGSSSTNGHLAIWANAWLSGGAHNTNWNVVGGLFNGADSAVYRNGSVLITGNASTKVINGITIGSNYDQSQEFVAGYLGELIIISGTLSQADREKLEGYLAWKWGLEGDLPVDHPYKSSAPLGPFTGYFSGYVYEQGVPAADRIVRAYNRSTGELVVETTSSGNGYYYLETSYSGAHYIVALDDAVGNSYNLARLDKMMPAGVV